MKKSTKARRCSEASPRLLKGNVRLVGDSDTIVSQEVEEAQLITFARHRVLFPIVLDLSVFKEGESSGEAVASQRALLRSADE